MKLVTDNAVYPNGQTTSDLDPFDPAQFRIDPNAESAIGIQKVITTIPVRKPNKTDFVRVPPGEEYRLDTYLIEIDADKETYLLHPHIVSALPDPAYYMATLYLGV